MPEKDKGGKAPVGRAPNTSTTEWIVAGLSALLVLGVLGFLVYDGVKSRKTPPDVRVEVDSIQPAGPGFLVILRARNDGHNTAADVIIEGELMADSGRLETSETTIDYVPAGGEQRAGLYFTRDPRRLKLRVRAQGYRDP